MEDPADIFATARPGRRVVGWKLEPRERGDLLARFPPAFATPVADHVTLKARVAEATALPRRPNAAIVGRADDGSGVEAMVVAIDGETRRPDGGTYHITWSLGPGRQARESNDVLAARGWQPLPEPVPITLRPALFR